MANRIMPIAARKVRTPHTTAIRFFDFCVCIRLIVLQGMQDYQERRNIRRFFASRFMLAVLFILVMLVGVASLRSLARSWEADQEHQQAEERLRDTLQKKADISREAAQMRSGYGVEREARDKLNLRKAGEEVVIIQDSPPSSNPASNAGSGSWLSQMFEALKGLFGGK